MTKLKSRHDYERAAIQFVKNNNMFSRDEFIYAILRESYDAEMKLSQNDIIKIVDKTLEKERKNFKQKNRKYIRKA